MLKLKITFLLILTTIALHAQWIKLPRTTGNSSFKNVQFVDDTTGWAYSPESTPAKTTNGGKNWAVQQVTSGLSYISSHYFVNKKEGLISYQANSTFYNKSTLDEGVTWRDVENIPSLYTDILTLQVINGMYIGSAIDLNNNISDIFVFKIKDNKFLRQFSTHFSSPINDMFFVDTLVGYCLASNTLRKTVNGGKSWLALRTGVNFELTKMHFTDALHGVAIGSSNIIYTANGGLSWKDVSIIGNKLSFNDVLFTSPKVGYVCGNQGILYKTTDGGLSWKEMDSGTFEHLYSLSFPDSTLGYCVGDAGTLLKLVEDYTLPKVSSLALTSNLLCAGAEYTISYAVNKKFNPDNVFTVYLSNAIGAYNARGAVGTFKSDTSGNIKITIPANTPRNIGYRIRIESSSPVSSSVNNEGFLEIQPAVIASISISPHKSILCNASALSLSATATNGGSKALINWYINNQKVGSGISFSYIAKADDKIFAALRSNTVCVNSDTVSSSVITILPSDKLNLISSTDKYVELRIPQLPLVTSKGQILTSSIASGNQWYLPNEPI